MHPLGGKLLPAIFLGYSQDSGGLWNGDLLLADWEDIGTAERMQVIPERRIKQN